MLFAIKFIIVYIIPVLLGMMCLFYRKSKRLYALSFAVCLAVMNLCKDSYDINSYRWAYDNMRPHGKEPLYDILQNFGIEMGVPFDRFRFLFLLATILFLYLGLKRYSEYHTLMLAFFIIMPFFSGFITQMRNSLAGAIVIFAVPYLYQKKKSGIVKYVIFIVIASFIHISVLFYLILIVPKFVHTDILQYRLLCITAAVVLSISVLLFFGYFAEFASAFRLEAADNYIGRAIFRAASYVGTEGRPNVKGYLYHLMIHLVFYLAAVISFGRLRPDARTVKTDEAIRILDTFILFIPCYGISYQLVRLFYYSLPMYYYFIAEYTGRQLENRRSGEAVTTRAALAAASLALFCIFFWIFWDTPTDFIRLVNGVHI